MTNYVITCDILITNIAVFFVIFSDRKLQE